MRGYIFLTISIITEVFATAMLKLSDGFSILLPSLGVTIGYGLSFYFISHALKTIPLSFAYAVWSGVGTALTAILGVVIWDELFNMLMLSGIILIISGVFFLNMSTKPTSFKKTSSLEP